MWSSLDCLLITINDDKYFCIEEVSGIKIGKLVRSIVYSDIIKNIKIWGAL